MTAGKTIIVVVLSVVITASVVYTTDQKDEKVAVAKAFEDGKAASVEPIKAQISDLKAKIATLVSSDEYGHQLDDQKLNAVIANLYHNGATKEEGDDLDKARRSQAWKSLKYRIIFGQEPDVK
jgi:hypothetical protein